MFDFNRAEMKILKRLNSPRKIQDWLGTIPINFEKDGETCRSPRRVLRDQTAHCLEGAMLAAAALWSRGKPPLLLDLKSAAPDSDHIVTLFQFRGRWGAISKTNHAVLRYREPIYCSVRELALSYFHEYFLDNGWKTLRSYSRPLNLARFRKRRWTVAEENLWYIPEALDDLPHTSILNFSPSLLRQADPIEIQAGELREWPDKHRRRRL